MVAHPAAILLQLFSIFFYLGKNVYYSKTLLAAGVGLLFHLKTFSWKFKHFYLKFKPPTKLIGFQLKSKHYQTTLQNPQQTELADCMLLCYNLGMIGARDEHLKSAKGSNQAR